MTDRLIRLPEVIQITSLSRTQIYRLIAAGTFPKQCRLSHKVAAWKETEIEEWIRQVTATGMRVVA